MLVNEELEDILNTFIRPELMTHGGDIKVVSFEDGIFRFRLTGSCAGCPSAGYTAEHLVKAVLLKKVEEVTQVELITGVSEELIEQARFFFK